ncbi:hypothetical protein Rhopal_007314-T1 [Rhodotorula paludigena]|uniref:Uncharacterized protein n=1 Tax=Rhodotorula paludigena TaxID=86838 RepID=A0AAV5GWB5_9BASI|nr:hypothetical protein Rhopal_007314-T1 [Rhodotorula paludigena]
MASVTRLLKREPALTPLFVAVGGGVLGSLAFASHYLRHSSDVTIDKKGKPEPWNNVQPGQNTKLWTQNPDFWASRKDHPNPRSVFNSPVEDESMQSFAAAASQAVQDAKERAAQKAKDSTMRGFERDGMTDSAATVRAAGARSPLGKESAIEH